jgi:hypothetical protein
MVCFEVLSDWEASLSASALLSQWLASLSLPSVGLSFRDDSVPMMLANTEESPLISRFSFF